MKDYTVKIIVLVIRAIAHVPVQDIYIQTCIQLLHAVTPLAGVLRIRRGDVHGRTVHNPVDCHHHQKKALVTLFHMEVALVMMTPNIPQVPATGTIILNTRLTYIKNYLLLI